MLEMDHGPCSPGHRLMDRNWKLPSHCDRVASVSQSVESLHQSRAPAHHGSSHAISSQATLSVVRMFSISSGRHGLGRSCAMRGLAVYSWRESSRGYL